MNRARYAVPVIALVAAAAAMSGCNASSRAFPYDRQTVWLAAVGQAIAWRPDRIDEKKYYVTSTKANLAGTQVKYELKVAPDPNPFARRPSTVVYVGMRQSKPRHRRFKEQEREFLMSVADRLGMASSPQ